MANNDRSKIKAWFAQCINHCARAMSDTEKILDIIAPRDLDPLATIEIVAHLINTANETEDMNALAFYHYLRREDAIPELGDYPHEVINVVSIYLLTRELQQLFLERNNSW